MELIEILEKRVENSIELSNILSDRISMLVDRVTYMEEMLSDMRKDIKELKKKL